MKNTLLLLLCAFLFTNMAAQNETPTEENSQNTTAPSETSIQVEKNASEIQVNMYDGTSYFILSNDDIVLKTNNEFTKVGIKQIPPRGRETEFQFMLYIFGEQSIFYAVDFQGQVWQKKPPFMEIVGQVE